MFTKGMLGLLVFPLAAIAFSGGNGDHVGNGGGLAELTVVKTYEDLRTLQLLCTKMDNPCELQHGEQTDLSKGRWAGKVFFRKEENTPPYERKNGDYFFSSKRLYRNGVPLPQEELVPLALEVFFDPNKDSQSLRKKLSDFLLENTHQENLIGAFRFYFSSRRLVSDFFVVEEKESSTDLAGEMGDKLCGDPAIVHLSRLVYRELAFSEIQVVGIIQATCRGEEILAKFQISLGEERRQIDFWNIRRR